MLFGRLFLLGTALGLMFRPSLLPAATAITGQMAPDWTLEDLDGQAVGLSDFAGKVVLLNFFRSACAPCLWETPDLVWLQDQYRSQGLAIVGVSAQETPETLRAYVESQGVNYPILRSVDSILWDYNVFPIGAIPLTVVIDRKGVIVDWYRYYQSRSFHEEKILPVLNAAPEIELLIQDVDGSLEVTWPAEADEFVLESRSIYDFARPWALVTEKIERVGDRFRIVRPLGHGNAFFRLRKP